MRRKPARTPSCPDLSETGRGALRALHDASRRVLSPRSKGEGSAVEKERDSRNSPSSVKNTLLLAPILARRLDAPTSGSHPGAPSSRSSSNSRSSPRNSVEGSKHRHMFKLPSLLRNLEGRNSGSPLVGSSNLSQALVAKDCVGSPSGGKTPSLTHNFDVAKIQVDKDLEVFKADVVAMADKLEGEDSVKAMEKLSLIDRALDIVEECLESSLEDFKLTVTDIVDSIEEDRSDIDNPTIKALFTRLLFILSRCSRLLITEQLNLYATEPRSNRFISSTNSTAAPLQSDLQAPSSDDFIYRSQTVPPTDMKEFSRKIKVDIERASNQSAASFSRISSGTPDGRLSGGKHLPHTVLEARFEGASTSGSMGAVDAFDQSSAPSGGSGSERPSTPSEKGKKQGIFNKISKSIRSTMDNLKKKVKDGVGSREPSFLVPTVASPDSSNLSKLNQSPQGLPSSGPSGPTSASALSMDSNPTLGSSVASISSKLGGGKRTSSGQRYSVGRLQVRFSSTTDKADLPSMELLTTPTVPPARLSSAEGRARHGSKVGEDGVRMVMREGSIRRRAARIGSADDSFLTPTTGSLFSANHHGESGWPFQGLIGCASEPEELDMMCLICEERWAACRLEEHSELCAVLQSVAQGMSVDAHLTTLANVIEEQLEMGELSSLLRREITILIVAARAAAALQPDGSRVPSTRCMALHQDLSGMVDPANSSRLSTVTITYARRILKLVEAKEDLLVEAFDNSRGLARKLRRNRSGGPRHAVTSDSGTGDIPDSGSSTPRSPHATGTMPPGISIEDFEPIKFISRGAFGRVYLARKHATKELFAIKVMKKMDLIRKNMVESVTNERNILAMANNPFVVRFYYSFTNKENLFIVMEYVNGGDCYSLLRKFGALDEDVARLYIAETVLALEYCHAQGIIHRDMKPDNLLIASNGHVKLTDFGLSCIGVIDRTDNLNESTPGNVAVGPTEVESPHRISNSEVHGGSVHGGSAEQEPATPGSQVAAEDRTYCNESGTLTEEGYRQVANWAQVANFAQDPPSSGDQLLESNTNSKRPFVEQNRMEATKKTASGTNFFSEPLYRISYPGAAINPTARTTPSTPPENVVVVGYSSHTAVQAPPSEVILGNVKSPTLDLPPTASGEDVRGDDVAPMQVDHIERRSPDTPASPGITAGCSGNTTLTGRLAAPETETKKAVGTPDYLAPELLLGTGHGPEVDWWALGVILYEFVVGVPPFNAGTPEEIFDNILDRRIEWPDDEDMTPECRDLIDKLLTPNPQKRLGHRGAGEIKLHPWFQDVDWTDLARTKATFVPALSDETDVSYFEQKAVSAKSMAEDLQSLNVRRNKHRVQKEELLSTSAKSFDSDGSRGSRGACIPLQSQDLTSIDPNSGTADSERTSDDGSGSRAFERLSRQPSKSRFVADFMARSSSQTSMDSQGVAGIGVRNTAPQAVRRCSLQSTADGVDREDRSSCPMPSFARDSNRLVVAADIAVSIADTCISPTPSNLPENAVEVDFLGEASDSEISSEENLDTASPLPYSQLTPTLSSGVERDPFSNFSFVNYTVLTQENREKVKEFAAQNQSQNSQATDLSQSFKQKQAAKESGVAVDPFFRAPAGVPREVTRRASSLALAASFAARVSASGPGGLTSGSTSGVEHLLRSMGSLPRSDASMRHSTSNIGGIGSSSVSRDSGLSRAALMAAGGGTPTAFGSGPAQSGPSSPKEMIRSHGLPLEAPGSSLGYRASMPMPGTSFVGGPPSMPNLGDGGNFLPESIKMQMQARFAEAQEAESPIKIKEKHERRMNIMSTNSTPLGSRRNSINETGSGSGSGSFTAPGILVDRSRDNSIELGPDAPPAASKLSVASLLTAGEVGAWPGGSSTPTAMPTRQSFQSPLRSQAGEMGAWPGGNSSSTATAPRQFHQSSLQGQALKNPLRVGGVSYRSSLGDQPASPIESSSSLSGQPMASGPQPSRQSASFLPEAPQLLSPEKSGKSFESAKVLKFVP